MSNLFRRVIVLLASIVAAVSVEAVRGATISFSPVCDLSWQTCCDCGLSEKCINWGGLSSPAPACPSFPTRLDDVIINIACQVEPLPALGAVAGSISQSGGVFLLDGALSVDTTAVFGGTMLWQGGSLLRAQDIGVTVSLNSGMSIEGNVGKSLGADGLLFGGITAINNSTITWTDAGNLTLGMDPTGTAPAIIRNSVGRVIDAQSNASILSTAFGPGRIENNGTIQKSSGGGVSNWDVTLFSDGLVHVKNGELRITGGGHAAGEFRMDAGTRLVFAPASPFELLPGVAFNGAGQAVLVDTGNTSGIDVRQTVQLSRFSVEDSGQIGPTVEADFGVVEVTGQLSLSGAFVFPPIHILNAATLSVSGPNASTVGDLSIAGIATIGGATLASNAHAIVVSSTGVVELNDDGGLRSAGAAGLPIQNNGIVRKSAGAGVSNITAEADVAFRNAAGATIDVTSGVLSFDMDIVSEGNLRVGSGSTLRALRDVNLNAGLFNGTGTLAGNVNVAGAVVSPGPSVGVLRIASNIAPTVDGNYSQGTAATLRIEVGGLNSGTLHDALVVEGQAVLNGTLELTLINGFIPTDGDIVTVLTARSVTGAFSSVDATNLPAGVTMQVFYSSTGVVATFSVPGNDNTNSNDNNANDNNNNTNDNSNTNDNNSNANGNINANDNTPGNTNDNNSNTNTNGNTNQNDNTNPVPSPTPGCGNGACGTSAVAFMPLMLAGLGARKMRGLRRGRAARRNVK